MTCSNSCPECSPTTPESRALKPTISICNGPRSYLLIGRDTLRSLNNPEYITLLVNWDVPSVAVMECYSKSSSITNFMHTIPYHRGLWFYICK